MFPPTAGPGHERTKTHAPTQAPSQTPSLWDGPARVRPRLDAGEADVVVVGAGVTGLTTALQLARSGLDVVVLEALHVGALASGRNTGKVSTLQGTKLSRLAAQHPDPVVHAYVEANRQGAAWLREFCDHQGVRVDPLPSITYAPTRDDVEAIAAELAACRRFGLPAQWQPELDVPFEVHGAVSLVEYQFQLDPRAMVLALADEVEHQGGRIGEGQRVTDISWGRRPRLATDDGTEFRCRHLVLATGFPILDRGLYFAKLVPRRSYLLALTGEFPAPPGMMISAGSRVRSLRAVPGPAPALLVGGGGHVVGRGRSESERVEELRTWAASAYPGTVETHAWSAQDYTSHDGIPYVGKLPRGLGNIWLASGYDKWGLANGASAGLRIAASILGSPTTWARPLERRVTRPAAAADLVVRNAAVVREAVVGLARAETRTVSPALPERTGEVGRAGADPRPVGVVGAGCAVRAVCTHLGGTLRWNDAERSWDCPLHGSRFSADGTVIEGPAVHNLDRLDE